MTRKYCNWRPSSKWADPVSDKMVYSWFCFSEITDQNHYSCTHGLCKRESFDLQLLWELKSHTLCGTKGLENNQNFDTGTLRKPRVCCPVRSSSEATYHKWSSSKIPPLNFPHRASTSPLPPNL